MSSQETTRRWVRALRLGQVVRTADLREHREWLDDELERYGLDFVQERGTDKHIVIARGLRLRAPTPFRPGLAPEPPKLRVQVRRAFDRVMLSVDGCRILLSRTEVHALAVRLLEASVPSSAEPPEDVDAFGLVDAGRVGAELQRATAAERDAVELAEQHARRADAMAQVLQPLMMVCEWLAEYAEKSSEDLLDEAMEMAFEVLPRLRALGGKEASTDG